MVSCGTCIGEKKAIEIIPDPPKAPRNEVCTNRTDVTCIGEKKAIEIIPDSPEAPRNEVFTNRIHAQEQNPQTVTIQANDDSISSKRVLPASGISENEVAKRPRTFGTGQLRITSFFKGTVIMHRACCRSLCLY